MNSLSILNNIEEKVVDAINTAALSIDSLSDSLNVEDSPENFNRFQSLSDRFYSIVKKDIHKGLIDFIDSMTDIAPFDHSSYLKKAELDVSHSFTEIILSHLDDLNTIIENHQLQQQQQIQQKELKEKEKEKLLNQTNQIDNPTSINTEMNVD
ncbi:hypothetical protein DICPUDRAFT_83566 [Dictyostelium purpureum]|uniref:Mediator of RNA polymerase II transcription subunit 11 n=1 Tax=Dictyostelium purpureum TaxID=5786 RepID=F0ZZW9_DICPU|nr:uncharacterized protein DICPUDRAFT_83566 [Dictyostelium purpureum]EGC30517.1 hypothetical protein DICPUDRAFT_83566 [Dictyostelium purpureum]|eukprot:XP_003292965.1 hypothetical protein DICPUDRAFT_83566 [Dictyostelium purpureum]